MNKLLKPIIISGPSGVGKTTFIQPLLKKFPNKFSFTCSHTTRQPRPGETHGIDYYFTTHSEMKTQISMGEFIEHAEFAGNLYGTSHHAVKSLLENEKIPILDLDEQGVKNMKKQGGDFDGLFIFIGPPSVKALEKRLIGRGTENEESLKRRMAAAKSSIEYAMEAGVYDVSIVNDDFDSAYVKFESFLKEQFDL